MTNTNSRMENGANLSQSMDSVNNVTVGGEEEVRDPFSLKEGYPGLSNEILGGVLHLIPA